MVRSNVKMPRSQQYSVNCVNLNFMFRILIDLVRCYIFVFFCESQHPLQSTLTKIHYKNSGYFLHFERLPNSLLLILCFTPLFFAKSSVEPVMGPEIYNRYFVYSFYLYMISSMTYQRIYEDIIITINMINEKLQPPAYSSACHLFAGWTYNQCIAAQWNTWLACSS